MSFHCTWCVFRKRICKFLRSTRNLFSVRLGCSFVPYGEASGLVPFRYSDFYLIWNFLYPVSSDVPVLMYLEFVDRKVPNLEVVLVGPIGFGYSDVALNFLGTLVFKFRIF